MHLNKAIKKRAIAQYKLYWSLTGLTLWQPHRRVAYMQRNTYTGPVTERGGRIGRTQVSRARHLVSSQTNDLKNWYLSLPGQVLDIIRRGYPLDGSVSG